MAWLNANFFAALLVLLPWTGALAHEASPELTVQVVGPPQVVFDHAQQACAPWDVPDAPARAWKDALGQTALLDTHSENRLSWGTDLFHTRHNCTVVFSGKSSANPAAFSDQSWLASPYTADGHTVYSLVHNEFQGYHHPGLCPTGRYIDCWYNAVTLAISHDGGHHFEQSVPNTPVASLPYPYAAMVGGHHGYFNPSNILTREGWQYAFVFATRSNAQQPGNCLMHTNAMQTPSSWTAWDGTGFTVHFVNPYNPPPSWHPEQHVCTPVDPAHLPWPVSSVVQGPDHTYLASMMNAGRGPKAGVYISQSRDLTHWSVPVKVLSAVGHGAFQCGDPAPIDYPSLLDPASPGRIYDQVGTHPFLFVTRFNVAGCTTGTDRDLIAFPLRVLP